MSIAESDPHDNSSSPANPSDVQPKSPALDPSLLAELLADGLNWIVAHEDDAAQLRTHGFPTLCVPEPEILSVQPVKAISRLVVLQRPGEAGAAYGLEVKRRLARLGWRRPLTLAFLPDPFWDLTIAARETGPEHFAAFVAGLAAEGVTEVVGHRPRGRGAADNGHAATDKPMARPVVVTMSHVQREDVEWLWPPYIAIGKVCLLIGDPGIGKTLLMTQIAASLSLGEPLPDQQGRPTLDPGGPQVTLLLSTEDGLADTLKPRLEAAGADCTRIHVLTGWLGPEDEQHAFTLQHMEVLEEALKQYQPRLVVVDPIQAYIGGVDMHRANEVRPLLAGLTRLAERYRCAVVCIQHPGKPGQGEGKVIHRGLGSVDFVAAARTALFVEQHPTDPIKALMAQSKSNIGPLGRTQVYSKAQGVFRWCGVSRLTAELMAGSGRGPDPHAFLAVVCWLEEHLKPGIPRAVTKIFEELDQEGYSPATAKRAKKALGIVSLKSPQGWRWRMPILPPLPAPLKSLDPLKPLDPLEPLQQPQGDTEETEADREAGAEAQAGQEVQGDQEALVVPGESESPPPPPPTPAADRPPVEDAPLPPPTKPHTRFCGGRWFWRRRGGQTWQCLTCQPPKPDDDVAERYGLPGNGQGAG